MIPQSREHLLRAFNEGAPIYLDGRKVAYVTEDDIDDVMVHYRYCLSPGAPISGFIEWYRLKIQIGKKPEPAPTAEKRLAALEKEVERLQKLVERLTVHSGITP